MVKRDQKALLRIIRRLESEYQEEAKEAAEELYTLLDRGCKVEAALAQLRKDHPALFQLSGLQDAMVEAAAYGYGIVPAILTDTQAKAWRRALSKSWDDSGMTLSEKIHGAGVKMRESIISTTFARRCDATLHGHRWQENCMMAIIAGRLSLCSRHFQSTCRS